ncbi:Hypothetical_protein [Hexamita inflata]|uniref:Hypothetical_protein n=1 Tax=Hexamita inflata TaxID=28002 RepID=A0ABP1H710_9EUKA
MQYYQVTLPKNQKISDNKNKIKQVCTCEMKNSGYGIVLVQVSYGNIYSLQNYGFGIEQVNGYNEQLFALFQEPKVVRDAIKNHAKKEKEQQNQQQGMQQGFQNNNQRQHNQQQNAYQNQPNHQKQHQPNRQVHNENVEQIFQPKQYQQQNFNPQQQNQQRQPNPVQKPAPINYMGQAKPVQQPVQYQQIQQPFQQPVQQYQPVQQARPQQYQQPVYQQPVQQPRNPFPQIPQVAPPRPAPVQVKDRITLQGYNLGAQFVIDVNTYLKNTYTGCSFQISGSNIIATGSPLLLNEVKKMAAQHYTGTFTIIE